MQIHRYHAYNRVHPALKILLALLIIAGIAFSLAWVWQTTEQAALADSQSSAPASESASSTLPESSTVSESEYAIPVESSASEDGSSPMEESEAEVAPAPNGAVPESEPVDATYFDDALFLGDSITTGISLYHIADNAAVVAETGISPANILTKPCIPIDDAGNRATILDAAAAYGPRSKVYIMLGGNGIGSDKATFISSYKAFLDAVQLQYPDAIIYLQSMTPVVHDYVNEFDPTMNNAKIDEYNLEILALAQQEGAYYLDVNSALKDETGALPKEASPVDGLHFSPEYYAKWFDYLKTHTISVEENQA